MVECDVNWKSQVLSHQGKCENHAPPQGALHESGWYIGRRFLGAPGIEGALRPLGCSSLSRRDTRWNIHHDRKILFTEKIQRKTWNKYDNDKMLQRWRVHMLVATPVIVNLKSNQSNFLMFSTVRYNGLLLHQSRTKNSFTLSHCFLSVASSKTMPVRRSVHIPLQMKKVKILVVLDKMGWWRSHTMGCNSLHSLLSTTNLHASERMFSTIWHSTQVDAGWLQYCFPL